MARIAGGKQLVLVLAITVCAAGATPSPVTPALREEQAAGVGRVGGARADGGIRFVTDDQQRGLRLRLFEAAMPDDAAERLSVAKGRELEPDELERLLARLPALEPRTETSEPFAVRQSSPPAPRAGALIETPFPPPPSASLGAAAPTDAGEPARLEVVRYAPEGEVPLAPHVSLTFSRPMVAVTSQDEASAVVPARVEPEVAGHWRWIGTRTLLFDPETRLPMATEYRVTVPAGTRSATGEELAAELTFEFATPPPGLVARHPTEGPHGLDPVIVLGFDQRIDAEAMLSFVRLRGPDGATSLRLARDEELAADVDAAALAGNLEPGRWVAVRPENRLKPGTGYSVVVRRDAPSAEGRRVTPGPQSFTFHTYEPLRVTDTSCSWSDDCPPDADWSIELNNNLDAERFDPAAFRVEPDVPGLRIELWDDTIEVGGLKRGRTRHTVTLPATLTDEFGQTLGREEVVTFDVGPAEPTLFGPGQPVVILDPESQPVLPVFSVNHEKLRVRVHRMGPDDWATFGAWQRRRQTEDSRPGPLPGEPLVDTTIAVEGEPDGLTETLIDLGEHVDGGEGQFLVQVEPTRQPRDRWRQQEVLAWVQVTDLGVTAFADDQELVVWTTDLGSGAAVSGAEVMVWPGGPSGTTDEAGLARLQLQVDAEGPQVLVVRDGDDVALLPQAVGWWNDGAGWSRVEPRDRLLWYVFDERGIYRPGDEVRVKGWLRVLDGALGGDVEALDGTAERVRWLLRGPRGNEIARGAETISSLGGFDLELELPADVNLGTAWLELRALGDATVDVLRHSHGLEIQEFRRPEFEVTSRTESGPFLLGEQTVVSAEASYYAGGALPGASVEWSVYSRPGSFVPPNRGDFQFGHWSSWWRRPAGDGEGSWQSHSGDTDAAGKHHLGMHFEALSPPRPTSVRAEATIIDVNRQAWTATSEILVHPANIYVGIRTAARFVGLGEKIQVEAIVVDLDGVSVAGSPIEIRFARLDWTRHGERWVEEEIDPLSCEVVSSDDGVSCEFEPEIGGTYKLTASVRDDAGRPNETEVRAWVAGGTRPPARRVEQEDLDLVPERREYRPGEAASFLVQSPFWPAEGIVTVRRDGILNVERFALAGPTTTLTVPIHEEHIPGVTVQVDVVGSAKRVEDGSPAPELPGRPAFATGSLTFDVPPLERALTVTVTPSASELAPGAETDLGLRVVDADGDPVEGAEIAVVVADEAVLALTGYELIEPLGVFYTARGEGVVDHHSRDLVLLAGPDSLRDGLSATSGGGPGERLLRSRGVVMAAAAEPEMMMDAAEAVGGVGGGDAPIVVRTDFSPVALFAPEVVTDREGTATVPLHIPDSLTRYRVMAVAVAGARQFGAGEASITARLPLMVRPSPPRFLNFGDKVEVPVVVQNQTSETMTVDVAMRAFNLELGGADGADTVDVAAPTSSASGLRVSVPANDRVEVRFAARTVSAGIVQAQAVAAVADTSGAAEARVAAAVADAADFELPVWTPATAEAFATYGVLDDGVAQQPVRSPADVWPQFGGLEVTTASTQLQALTDAVLYLVEYPFECVEQLASRVLAIAALRDVLGAFAAEGLPDAHVLEAKVASDLERLAARQNGDGGFGFWRRGDSSWPFLSIHVANALTRARDKDFEVPDSMWRSSLRYLQRIEANIPEAYPEETRRVLRAYALNVAERMDVPDVDGARALIAEAGIDGLPIEALGWLLPVLASGLAPEADEVLRHLDNRVAETAATAHFVTNYADGAHLLLHSDRRVDGVVLEALVDVRPESDLIPKLVRGLLDNRVRGRWTNTQENAFVLLALDRYFNTFEATTPDFVSRVWLGDRFAGEHAFRGHTTERSHTRVPMSLLGDSGDEETLWLQKDGGGRMYYRIGMKYAPRTLDLGPADHGFAVEREYEAIDDPADVRRDDDGTWRIRAGARVRTRLTMVASGRRTHVALVDPLPAGFEVVNPELAVSGTLPRDAAGDGAGADRPERYWWWWRPWYEHENLRDERVEAFTSLLWSGVHSYRYVARATTPGAFVVPPTRAEEMYHPETFGRGRTARVIIE